MKSVMALLAAGSKRLVVPALLGAALVIAPVSAAVIAPASTAPIGDVSVNVDRGEVHKLPRLDGALQGPHSVYVPHLDTLVPQSR